MGDERRPRADTRWGLTILIGLSPVFLAALLVVGFLAWLVITGGAHGFLR